MDIGGGGGYGEGNSWHQWWCLDAAVAVVVVVRTRQACVRRGMRGVGEGLSTCHWASINNLFVDGGCTRSRVTRRVQGGGRAAAVTRGSDQGREGNVEGGRREVSMAGGIDCSPSFPCRSLPCRSPLSVTPSLPLCKVFRKVLLP